MRFWLWSALVLGLWNTPSLAQTPKDITAWFGHHTTVVEQRGSRGPYTLALALLPDGTGWQHAAPGAGNTGNPDTRYIYRWWVAQDNRLCVLYSPGPQFLNQNSLWRCYHLLQTGTGFAFVSGNNTRIWPVVSHTPGNTLGAQAQAFFQVAQEKFGPQMPRPQDPVKPPPR